ncbi:tRNAHis guanylyltransferase-domain-containing protein [Butyriboletus roseoflavus]|nr:tRNAHis guanylyltransferase-domain-containing protein [Butyriboletus roseoflavus]
MTVTLSNLGACLNSNAYMCFYVKRHLDYKPYMKPTYRVTRDNDIVREQEQEKLKEMAKMKEVDVAFFGSSSSKYAFVRNFELPDPLPPGCFLVCRLCGHPFHRVSEEHAFTKPNDERALQLMDHAAKHLMTKFEDIVLCFDESDESRIQASTSLPIPPYYLITPNPTSFLLRKSTDLYNRRHAKILSTITSYFTSCYVFHWPRYFPDTPLRYPPSFDGRVVLHPDERAIRDCFAWQQADTHINNLHNTGGLTTTEAHTTLRVMSTQFKINYNDIPGAIQERKCGGSQANPRTHGTGGLTEPVRMQASDKYEKPKIEILHCDVIGNGFWDARPYVLGR